MQRSGLGELRCVCRDLIGAVEKNALGRLRETGLPPHSVGFVYLPALGGIVVASMLVAPLGAAAAHRLPTAWLRRIFAVLFYVIATRMLIKFL